jgi:aerobic-type carbon monoxide dehydrogenase small subunit (CoxS/CutS family)
MKLTINGKVHQADAPGDMPLLWVMRDKLNILGLKFGCGIARAVRAQCWWTASQRGLAARLRPPFRER